MILKSLISPSVTGVKTGRPLSRSSFSWSSWWNDSINERFDSNSSGNILLELDALIYEAVFIKYIASRSFDQQSGTIYVQSINSTTISDLIINSYNDVLGITLSSEIVDGKIRVLVSVDNSSRERLLFDGVIGTIKRL